MGLVAMSTIMTWGSSSGEQGRCDAKCHEAEHPRCECMCSGLFHGSARDGTLDEKVQNEGRRLLEQLASEGKINEVQPTLM